MESVSTIIPAYNAERFIANAVNSALAQTHARHEIFVVDDGSTDDTPRVLRRFGDAVRVIHQANGGHVRARNHGAQRASGDWLAFLDADDEWLPEKLEKQLRAAEGDVGLIYTDRENFGEIGRVGTRASTATPLCEGDVFERLLLGNFITVSSVLVRREWFERLGGFDADLLVCEDWDLWLRFSAAGGIVRAVEEALTRYRWHSASMTNNQERMCQGRLRVLERALASTRGKAVSRSLASRARGSVWKCSAWYAARWKPSMSLRWYLESARHWPWDLDVYKWMLKCCLKRI
jgi:glycosyltransferase involved in cell wall biosynthesis